MSAAPTTADRRIESLLREIKMLGNAVTDYKYENTTLRNALCRAEEHRREDIALMQETIEAKDAHANDLRAEIERLRALVIHHGGQP